MIVKWLKGSGLVVNESKTEICLFHTNDQPLIMIKLQDSKSERENCFLLSNKKEGVEILTRPILWCIAKVTQKNLSHLVQTEHMEQLLKRIPQHKSNMGAKNAKKNWQIKQAKVVLAAAKDSRTWKNSFEKLYSGISKLKFERIFCWPPIKFLLCKKGSSHNSLANWTKHFKLVFICVF